MQSTNETYFNKQHAFLLKNKKDDKKKSLIFNISQPMNANSKDKKYMFNHIVITAGGKCK